ncbi:Aerobic glycerol-3-phosphate dehydrogenase [Tepidimonas thermarum]|uniref:Glycerol-3-phosphate dehydrogenase n=1 Tax=Tepidimonas thermarum TaxID=335431 RepID=A0A554X2H2_9BURK|nr:glycerol-3-phosphate dehydrogenase [Tepidimonas thermarum]TSE30049.1 Aerobic glycerol-3-phosphate dehydrogenase [Tepidimonas thermarum]
MSAPTAPSEPAPALAVDVLIVGGGINGCGIARDLAGRGVRVLLCEQDDLAAHTSSASSKLIHGGLRYLEYGELRLVRKALAEREVLMRMAPHLIEPLRFVMPHDAAMRPAWMIRTGLWLYDHLARRAWLPASQALDLARDPAGALLQPQWRQGFAYADGWTDDARLVVLNALDAAQRGAQVRTRTRCERLQRHGAGWIATLTDAAGQPLTVQARVVVNAAGPWAERLLRERAGLPPRRHLRLVRGSHIVVPRLPGHTDAYLLQARDRRVVFVLPFEQRFSLIGTTDVEHTDDPGQASIAPEEIDYLCREVNRYLRTPIAANDVVWHYSGVRPLLDDGGDAAAVTRDYRLELDTVDGAALLTVWGGKITTYRTLAREAVQRLQPVLGLARVDDWTAHTPLPGGDMDRVVGPCATPMAARQRLLQHLRARWPWLDAATAARWVRAYGTLVLPWLQDARGAHDLGREVAPGLYEVELQHGVEHEWVHSADDVLWRRSKLGLHLTPRATAAVQDWLQRHGRATLG